VHCREKETGTGLLLLHAMAGSMTPWDRVVPALTRDITVVVLDLPGHGGSEKLVGDLSLGAFATTLRAVLVALGHDRATVVGQSLGGGVAMQFANQYPELWSIICWRSFVIGEGGGPP